jgi:velvet factor protein
MGSLQSSITTTRCRFRPHHMRPAIRLRHCHLYKDSRRQDMQMRMTKLPRARIRLPARRARGTPRLKKGRARTSCRTPVLRMAGDMRKWPRLVNVWHMAEIRTMLTRIIPDSLDVVQQPLRARMCGFGDKVHCPQPGSPRLSNVATVRIGDQSLLHPVSD